MYKPKPNISYASRPTPSISHSSKRFRYKQAIFQRLRNAAASERELMKDINVPGSERKTFDRAVKDLVGIGVLTKDEKSGKLYAYGHEPPETVEINVGSSNLKLTFPVNREQAKKIVKKCPSLRKDKETSTVLKETEIL